MHKTPEAVSIIVVGASGDLARKKVLPALFALYCQGHLPPDFRVFGFARSDFTDDQFRDLITEHLTCRYAPGVSCADRMRAFLARCFYVSGQYASADSILDLYQVMRQREEQRATPRLFYLAIPPSVFLDVARALGDSGLVECDPHRPWSRAVIEKPFGRDRKSSDQMTRELARVFGEAQTYRIDHYLAKEVIQNLMALRFANLVFEPLWNRNCIKSVLIRWKEDIGVEGRGGYFDAYGIIRDVMQNHLLQILALIAMEPPAAATADAIRNRKVEVLRSMPPLTVEDLVLGQYDRGTVGGREMPGYGDDAAVPKGSLTPTLAAAVLRVENARWRGVPFFVFAGKATDERVTEIRLRFRGLDSSIFCRKGTCPEANELIIRVQPDEAIDLKIVNKVPGLGMELQSRNLDLRYKAAFTQEIPDAYESLLLDVIRGEKSLFIRKDELAAAWDVFTPALHELEHRKIRPEPYAFGSRGPATVGALAARYGVEL